MKQEQVLMPNSAVPLDSALAVGASQNLAIRDLTEVEALQAAESVTRSSAVSSEVVQPFQLVEGRFQPRNCAISVLSALLARLEFLQLVEKDLGVEWELLQPWRSQTEAKPLADSVLPVVLDHTARLDTVQAA